MGQLPDSAKRLIMWSTGWHSRLKIRVACRSTGSGCLVRIFGASNSHVIIPQLRLKIFHNETLAFHVLFPFPALARAATDSCVCEPHPFPSQSGKRRSITGSKENVQLVQQPAINWHKRSSCMCATTLFSCRSGHWLHWTMSTSPSLPRHRSRAHIHILTA